METCDAVIIGGGPAGSTCARALTDAGLDVVLLDQATFPRDKPCAGWITPPVVHLLRLDLGAYRGGGRVCQPITAFRTSRLGRAAIDTDFETPVSYGILRRELDHYLLARCGARLRTGEPLTSLRREGGSASRERGAGSASDARAATGVGDAGGEDAARAGDWIVNDAIRTPLVIGAGGHFCPVAKRMPALARDAAALAAATAGGADLGIGVDARVMTDGDASAASDAGRATQSAGELVVAAQEIEVRLTPAQAAACRVSGERPELFLCEDFKGYGWCFRKEDVLNIGLGRLDRHHLAAHVRTFADGLVSDGRIPRDLEWRWKGHAYLVREASPRALVADGLLLVGDAAGLAYGRSGEGIRPAIESALLAAQTIVAAGGRYPRAALDPYRAAIESRFGAGAPRGAASSVAVSRAPAAAHAGVGAASASASASGVGERLGIGVATLLMSSRWFTRHVLLRRWFLRMADAPLPLPRAAGPA